MRIGPFAITGDVDERTTDAVRQLIAKPFPWHVLLTRKWTIHLDHAATTYLAGIVRGDTLNIWGPWEPETHYKGGTPWAIAHEVGHAVDSTLFRPYRHVRNDIHAVMHGGVDHDHLLDNADLPHPPEAGHAPHGWSGSGRTPHERAGGEAFAEWFAWWLGYHDRTSYGDHRWDRNTSSQIEEIVMAAADDVQVFADVHPEDTHAEAIHWAAGQGLVSGYGNGSFRPHEPVTRGQLASILKAYHERETA